ncbi:MAG: DUF4112 domain-containing protein [Planctomycetales bacterium]|nr:DUF4112 domain-containing protein [Planctomycetales bacterium]
MPANSLQTESALTRVPLARWLVSRPASRTVDAVEASERIRRVRRFAEILDSAVRIPGTSRRVGVDSLLGLIPVVGDTAAALTSAWILREAHALGVRKSTLWRMGLNIVLDAAVGSIPLAGDLFDFAFKSNLRNAKLLEKELAVEPSA